MSRFLRVSAICALGVLSFNGFAQFSGDDISSPDRTIQTIAVYVDQIRMKQSQGKMMAEVTYYPLKKECKGGPVILPFPDSERLQDCQYKIPQKMIGRPYKSNVYGDMAIAVAQAAQCTMFCTASFKIEIGIAGPSWPSIVGVEVKNNMMEMFTKDWSELMKEGKDPGSPNSFIGR